MTDFDTDKNTNTNSKFKSKWCLTLCDLAAEKNFQKMKKEKIINWNPYITIFIFIISIADGIFQGLMLNEYSKNGKKWIYITGYISYSVVGISFVLTILVFSTKNENIQKVINYLNNFLMTFPFFFTRHLILGLYLENTNSWVALFLLEYLIRILWVFMGLISFSETLTINLIIIMSLLIISPFITNLVDINSFNISYLIFIIFVIIIAYFYTKEIKINFYATFKALKQKEWFSNILENMNTGIFYLRDQKLNYINKVMYEKLQFNKEIMKLIGHSSIVNNIMNTEKENNILINNGFGLSNQIPSMEDFLQIMNNPENSEKLLDILLSDIVNESFTKNNLLRSMNIYKPKNNNIINDNEESKNIFESNINGNSFQKDFKNSNKKFSSKLFLNDVKKELYNSGINNKSKIDNNFEKFILLGYKDWEIDFEDNGEVKKDYLSFEIFLRFYLNTNRNGNSEHFEIIFNDVTRAKIIEEKNAEFRYKSLFLAKIVHEFKNPLICITELIEQIGDGMNERNIEQERFKHLFKTSSNMIKKFKNDVPLHDNKFENNLTKNLPLMKALSNYLLILVKDLDFFSQSQLSNNNKDAKNEYGEADLEEILQFCSEISKGLLKKNNKENEIDLVITKKQNVPDGIWTDETKLKQILINLLSNAIKFTQKGKIKVDVSKENDDKFKFEVTDSGAGMTDEVRENLFKPYKKSQDKLNKLGAGLGLSICRELVHKLGGNLEYSSKLGQGTIFSATIPCKKPNNYIIEHINKSKKTLSIIRETILIFENKEQLSSSDKISFYDFRENQMVNPSKFSNGNLTINKSINCSSDEPSKSSSKKTIELPEIHMKIEHRDNFNINDVKRSRKRFSSHDNLNVCINKQYFINKNYSNDTNKTNLKQTKEGDELSVYNSKKESTNNKINHSKFVSIKSIKEKEFVDNDSYNFIIADDEPLARQSTIRNFKKAANKSNKKITILESDDGVETLNIVYRSIIKGINISGIITDETMRVLKGSNFVEVIEKSLEIKLDIPIYLVSAYEDKRMIKNSNLFKDIFSKPLDIKSAQKIIEDL